MVVANEFHVHFHEQDNFHISLKDSSQFTSNFGEVQIVSDRYPTYEGEYEVQPHVYEQILATKHTSMLEDVSVKEILLSEVVNPQGGTTLIIE